MIRLLVALLLFPLIARAAEQIDVPIRPGVTQAVYLTPAAKPTGTVVLFPGGSGVVAQMRNNFLLRVAPRFVEQGFTTAVVDVPSDQPGGMTWPFRAGPQHAQDIGAIVAMLKARSPAPVWLIGTSMGSVSAGNGGTGGTGVAGVVLTSSVWEHGMRAVAADRIKVPVLIVHNRDDSCSASPFSGAAPFQVRLTAAPEVKLITVSGGSSRSDPCQALSPHGYLNIENQAMEPMIAWLRAH